MQAILPVFMAFVVTHAVLLAVAGQLIFDEDTAVTRLLHNETAFMIQRRLQHAGVPMVVLPVRLNLGEGPRITAPSLTRERTA